MDRFMKLAGRAMGKDSLLGDERGLTTVEYVIILVLIAVLAISVWKTFGDSIKSQVTNSTDAINDLNSESPAAESAPAPKK